MSALPRTNTPELAYMAAILEELCAIRQLLQEQHARSKPGRKPKQPAPEAERETEEVAHGV
jgi:hypothetical protein